MSNKDFIKISVADTGERKRSQRELWFGIGGVFLIILLSWIELKYIGVDSYLFLALFNFNFILLIVILVVVLRNLIRLLLERRRNVLGSRLRTRLVVAFISLSLVPTLVMFFISLRFMQTSIDFWFDSQVGESMEESLEVGQTFYDDVRERLKIFSESVTSDLRERKFAWGGKGMNTLLEKKKRQFHLGLIGVLTPDDKQQNWNADPEWEAIWKDENSQIDWENLKKEPRFWSQIVSRSGTDIVIGILPVDEGKTGWLVVGQVVGEGLLFKLDRIVRGVNEYRKLNTLRYPLQVALYVTLGVMTLLVILGAMWFGFRLAKELSKPVQALAAGTQRIARGEFGVRLEDQSSDELGFLVQSFNRMAEDLEHSQDGLKRANIRLAQQNFELEGRRRYMEAVLNNITSGVISLDDKDRISTVNKAAEAMLGIDAGTIMGFTPMELLPGQYQHMVTDVLQEINSRPGKHWQRQIDFTLGTREMKFLVNVMGLVAGDGTEAGVVAVFEDITEMEKMQRLAAWREVARRIAHEIKNPLTPIKLSAQRLERKFAAEINDRVFRESTALIIRQVEDMQRMVEEFSAFAKMPEVVLKPGNIAPIINELVSLFTHSHGYIKWTLNMDEEIPQLRLDREGMRRVLMNILSNAADVLKGFKEPRVDIDVTHDRILNLIRIEIRDNGPGLTDEERSRLFEPYFSRKKGGTGLGLTIARSVISDHRGYIRVRPNSPEGTIFIIELPTDA